MAMAGWPGAEREAPFYDAAQRLAILLMAIRNAAPSSKKDRHV
jgi:hypothetical protein